MCTTSRRYVTYLVSTLPIAEADSLGETELRTTDLGTIARRLGMSIVDLDSDRLDARRADLSLCPVCPPKPSLKVDSGALH